MLGPKVDIYRIRIRCALPLRSSAYDLIRHVIEVNVPGPQRSEIGKGLDVDDDISVRP